MGYKALIVIIFCSCGKSQFEFSSFDIVTQNKVSISKNNIQEYLGKTMVIEGFYYEDCTIGILFPSKNQLNKLEYNRGIEIGLDTTLTKSDIERLSNTLWQKSSSYTRLKGVIDSSRELLGQKSIGFLWVDDIQ